MNTEKLSDIRYKKYLDKFYATQPKLARDGAAYACICIWSKISNLVGDTLHGLPIIV